MLLLQDAHPALQNVLERMLRGENNVLHTAVKDFDGTEYIVELVAHTKDTEEEAASLAASPQTSAADGGSAAVAGSAADEEAARRRKYDIRLTIHHVVPEGVLNVFRNFDAVVRKRLLAAIGAKGTASNSQLVMSTFPASDVSPPTVVRARLPSSAPTLRLIIPANTTPEEQRDLACRFAQLRALSYLPLFQHLFTLFLGGDATAGTMQPIRIPYHPRESMYVHTARGNFFVTVSILVEGTDDQIFVRQFLQTFMDAKRLQKELAQAPGFLFTQRVAPAELPADLKSEPEVDGTFWVQFQLFKSHMEAKEDQLIKNITQLVNFRNTLMYHIHCCRTYMHSLMRKRVESSLLVLNRGRTNTTGRAKVIIK
mmetsp:Transcript_67370/g.78166  ORF Transcript_67370/g.78166 Transcript_67370/m.78166 type:complete len:369 (+) Transcript_67370:46-1152(+)